METSVHIHRKILQNTYRNLHQTYRFSTNCKITKKQATSNFIGFRDTSQQIISLKDGKHKIEKMRLVFVSMIDLFVYLKRYLITGLEILATA